MERSQAAYFSLLRIGNACVTVTRLLPKSRPGGPMRYYEAGSMIASMPDLGPSFERFAQGLERGVETGR